MEDGSAIETSVTRPMCRSRYSLYVLKTKMPHVQHVPPSSGPAILQGYLSRTFHLDHRSVFDAVRLCHAVMAAGSRIYPSGRPEGGRPENWGQRDIVRIT